MRWIRPLFVHVEVPRASIERHIPAGLTLDPQADPAMLSLVALIAEGPAPLRLAARLLRTPQLNVRAYVRGPQGPGIVFLETRVVGRFALAARALGMPYHRDPRLAYVADEKAVALRASGLAVKGLPAPDVSRELDADDPARPWLERYVTYGVLPIGLPYALRVDHPPWRVKPVEVDPDTRIELLGLPPLRVKSAQLAETVEVKITDILPVRELRHGVRGMLDRGALRLLRTAT